MNPANQKQLTYITAGAAGMYCGSCMHDNTLARALNEAGCDTLLVPTYTPIRSDEEDVAVDQVFFGGINVFLQQKIPLFRHVPKLLDRFLDQPWLIRKVTSRAIETDGKLLGSLTESMLRGSAGNQRKEVRRLVSWLRDTARPDVVILSNMLISGFVRELKQQLDVPIIVTLQGDDIFLESLVEPWHSRCIQLISELDEHVDRYMVHSRFYADFMADYLQLDHAKMRITPLGIDTSDFASESTSAPADDSSVTIGYLARLTEDKGLHHLVSAFLELKKDPKLHHVQLKIAGWLGRDHEAFAEEQFARMRDAGLEDQFEYLGSIERADKLQMLRDIDVLCVPTEYCEPKGLYVLEAMAAGVPVVQPAHGVFPELLEDLDGGLLFEPGNLTDLCNKLRQLIDDAALRQQQGATGRARVLESRNGSAMAAATLDVVDELLDASDSG
ncbi:MAG: glycosyltransferase family 4 protein [Pirellulaceae bacterium]